MLASEVFDLSASLQNDPNKEQYTVAAQLPHLKLATKELREFFELNGLPITNEQSAIITVPANTTVLSLTTVPPLPSDLIDIQNLWESVSGLDSWSPVIRREFLPTTSTSVQRSTYGVYAWRTNQIHLLPVNQITDFKLDYIRNMFTTIVDENSVLDILGGDSFLIFRTAALCAEFIGEDKPRATDLNGNASMALDRVLGIDVKGTQYMPARRRPFRSGARIRSGR